MGLALCFYQHYPTQFTAGSIKLSFSANALEPRLKKGHKLVALFFEWMSKDSVAESNAATALIAVRAED